MSTVLSQRELKPSVKQSISFTRGLLGFVYFTDAPERHVTAQGPAHLCPARTNSSTFKMCFYWVFAWGRGSFISQVLLRCLNSPFDCVNTSVLEKCVRHFMHSAHSQGHSRTRTHTVVKAEQKGVRPVALNCGLPPSVFSECIKS